MNLLRFFETASKLKEVERAGWTERGVKRPETSADHSFLVALMALVLGRKASADAFNQGRKRKNLRMEKLLKMALVHDLPEAIVGDIISRENWEKGGSMWNHQKVKKERPAMKRLASLAGSREILSLWEEFEAQKSPEARFVKEVDRLATIFQAAEYHKKGNCRKPLPPFWNGKGVSQIKDAGLRKFLELVLKSLNK